jgi:tRNA threonylcarbamoyladenosine modification (KEOPS) complex  Pcc1 subunit
VKKGRKIPRTEVNLEEDENSINLEIIAQDINALRAAMNSYLRWMKVSIDTYNEIKNRI